MVCKAGSPDEPKGFRGAVVHRGCGTVLLTVLAMAVALAGCQVTWSPGLRWRR